MRRITILSLLIILLTVTAVHASEYVSAYLIWKCRMENPCFDNVGKWYTRLEDKR